jgi:predicted nucleic acid-binding protein
MVLSDSSTLIHLAAIGHLPLLLQFFDHLVIPTAVWREIVEEGRGRPGQREVEEACAAGWIEVASARDHLLVTALKQELDEGEAELLALAVEGQARLVLADETEARRVAKTLGLKTTGIVGLLIRAKREGKINLLRPELDRLRPAFRIDDRLYQRALEAVGEAGEPERGPS